VNASDADRRREQPIHQPSAELAPEPAEQWAEPCSGRDGDVGGVGGVPVGLTAIVPMRRRHVRAVLRIEAQVYPRPWTASLFMSELALRSSRAYFVALAERDVIGYAGLMAAPDEGHVTTIAVDPAAQGQQVGTHLMLALTRAALTRGLCAMTLEVRMGNLTAQALYRKFGYVPVGVRPRYYPETNEDALIMWAHDVHLPDYQARLHAIERMLPGGPVLVTPVQAPTVGVSAW
jgi:[ribosomal protein S18]-alanine N-acetyltransferase